jgi:hypothetical protein
VSVSPDGSSAGDGTYIRGGGGVAISPRVLAVVLAGICIALLVAFAAYYGFAANRQSSNIAALRNRGVPVEATITGCVAVSSGVGMGIEYWQCRGSYTLEGRTFNEQLNGSRSFVETGRVVAAVAVPGDPGLLSTASSVRGRHNSTGSYIVSGVLGALAVVGAGGLLALRKSGRRRASAG